MNFDLLRESNRGAEAAEGLRLSLDLKISATRKPGASARRRPRGLPVI